MKLQQEQHRERHDGQAPHGAHERHEDVRDVECARHEDVDLAPARGGRRYQTTLYVAKRALDATRVKLRSAAASMRLSGSCACALVRTIRSTSFGARVVPYSLHARLPMRQQLRFADAKMDTALAATSRSSS